MRLVLMIASVLQSHECGGRGERIKVVRDGKGVVWAGALEREFIRVVDELGGCMSAWLSRRCVRVNADLVSSVTRCW